MRGALFVATAWSAGSLAVFLLGIGLDRGMDLLVDAALANHVKNGQLRLAGISAPLSEEPARLLGIVLALWGVAWMQRRFGLEHALEFSMHGLPWYWLFGMTAGLGFAVMETFTNGDPPVAIVGRTLAHGTWGSMVVLALAWRRRRGSTWPVAMAVLLAMVLHGLGNGLRAVDEGLLAARIMLISFAILAASALAFVRTWPSIFGVWSFSLLSVLKADTIRR